MPVFEQLVLPAILQCQHHSGSPPISSNAALQLGGDRHVRHPNPSESKELAQGLGLNAQYILHIINRSISNETPLALWTSPSPAMNRTTGKEKRELLIKATPLETRTTRSWAIFRCLITKWAFLKRQFVSTLQSQVALAHVASFIRPSVSNAKGTMQATASLLNLNLLWIQRWTDWFVQHVKLHSWLF